MQTGWICPRCGRSLAPWMPSCECPALSVGNGTNGDAHEPVCPNCGQPRSSPGGSGCPMGSHYGTYCTDLAQSMTASSAFFRLTEQGLEDIKRDDVISLCALKAKLGDVL